MGLLESSSQAGSILYILHAGAKDVGSYSCSQVTSDLVDIDEDPGQALFVFVTGSSLTPSDTSQVMVLPPSSPLHLPCLPSHTAVRVTVSASGEDVTHLFRFDPTVGFTALHPLTFPSYTCYFTHLTSTVSLHLVSSNASPPPSHLPVTLHTTTLTMDTEVEMVCKVQAEEAVEISWVVPGGQELHMQDLALLGSDKYSMEEVSVEGFIISRLVVEEVEEDDQGIYR